MNFYGEGVSGGCTHDFSKAMSNVLDLIIWLFDLNILLLIIMRLLFQKQLEFITNIDIKLKIDAYKFIRTKAEVFFDSVLKRLKRVKLDTFEKAEDGIQKLKN